MTPVQPGEQEPIMESSLVPLTADEAVQQQRGGDAGLPGDAPVDPDAFLAGGEAPKKGIPLDKLVLAGVILVAAGVLYGMRQMGVAPRESMAINTASLRLPESSRTRAEQTNLLADLGAARTSRQVPTEQVQKNPFQLLGMVFTPQGPDGDVQTDSMKNLREERDKAAKASAARALEITNELKTFELAAVIGGGQPVARINNKLYKIGDKVGKHHTLKNINSLQRQVELEADGKVVTLSMEKPGEKE